jgi:hypothetical protein
MQSHRRNQGLPSRGRQGQEDDDGHLLGARRIPREPDAAWPDAAKKLHAEWWEARIGRQREVDASIAAKADVEYLYDKPYVDLRSVGSRPHFHI